jgi:hypothetical protein
MTDDDPRRRSSSDTRHALTVALVKPGRGSCWNHAMNSFKAMLYTRFVIGEETLSSTSASVSPTGRFFKSQLSRSVSVVLMGIIGNSTNAL